MNQRVLMATLTCALVFNAAWANDDKPAKPNKMATCNKEAEGKKGSERKAVMKECLSAKAPAADTEAVKSKGTGSQQNKMKRCNEEAAGLKGDERKQKMSACLKS
jgi:hypothetical protein